MFNRTRAGIVVAALSVLAGIAAAPAQAGLSNWTSLPGLNSASGANWVREYATGTPPTTIYAATEGDGVYRSVTDGVSWSNFSSGLESTPGAMDVRTVFNAGGKVYAGTSAGLFASTGGGSWQPVAQGPEDDPAHPKKLNRSVQTVLSGPTGQLLAGTFAGGVYKSTDDGATWSPPAPGNGMPAGETVWSLASLAPNVIFAATSSGMYRSIDFGSTWTLASDGISGTTLRVFADGTRPNIYYAATPGDGVFRSINAGITWSEINGTGAHALGDLTVRALQQFNGVNETRLYAGTANGMYAGTTSNSAVPGPVTWRKVTNNGLGSNTIFWALTTFTTTPGTLLAGTQSDGGYALTLQPPSNQSVPTIAGTVQVGKTLTASPGTWNGTPTIEFEYQWQSCSTAQASSCADIPDATDSTYDLADSDFSKRVRVVVTGKNDFPTFGLVKANSLLTGVAAAKAGTLPGDNQSSTAAITTVAPGDPSLPQSGDTLHAQSWLFNPAATSVSFQWFRCDSNGNNCNPIPGATAQNYPLTDEDVTSRLTVAVTGTNAFGSRTLDQSGATNTIFPQQATNTSPPTLAGTPYVGESLVAGVGTWKFPGTTYTRQWESCSAAGDSCQTISGETGPSYTVRTDDVGSRLRVRIGADSNGPNTFPSPVEVFTPLSDVVTLRPAAPGDQSGGGGGAGGGGDGGAGGGGGGADLTPPALQSLSLTTRKVKRGGSLKFRYTLSEPGSLEVKLQSEKTGRKKGKKCVLGLKKGKKCTILKSAGTVTLGGLSGSGTASVKIKKSLAAGNYRAVVTPIDAAGNRGPAKTLKFKVTRR
ncbi:MAG: hypothetical protein QOJ07_3713 [Thermoleophilaceae bacterium]|nr:hypothetical protein [Thermoleophilaceae bacterium]